MSRAPSHTSCTRTSRSSSRCARTAWSCGSRCCRSSGSCSCETAVSRRRSNEELLEGFAWGQEAQDRSGAFVELFGDGGGLGLAVGDVGALGGGDVAMSAIPGARGARLMGRRAIPTAARVGRGVTKARVGVHRGGNAIRANLRQSGRELRGNWKVRPKRTAARSAGQVGLGVYSWNS